MYGQKPFGLRAAKKFLDVLFIICLVGAALLALATAAPLLGARPGDASAQVVIGDSYLMPIQRFDSDSPFVLSRPALVDGTAQLRFETSSRPLAVATTGSALLMLLIAAIGIELLRGVLGRVLEGRPFDPANAQALHRLSLLTAAIGVVAPAAEFLMARWVLGIAQVEGIALTPAFRGSLTPFLVALLLEGLAAVFRHGAELEAEQSLTI